MAHDFQPQSRPATGGKILRWLRAIQNRLSSGEPVLVPVKRTKKNGGGVDMVSQKMTGSDLQVAIVVSEVIADDLCFFCSYAKLMETTGLGEDAVGSALSRLVAEGFLEKLEKKDIPERLAVRMEQRTGRPANCYRMVGFPGRERGNFTRREPGKSDHFSRFQPMKTPHGLYPAGTGQSFPGRDRDHIEGRESDWCPASELGADFDQVIDDMDGGGHDAHPLPGGRHG